jgi:hypothetical protein
MRYTSRAIYAQSTRPRSWCRTSAELHAVAWAERPWAPSETVIGIG